VYHSFLYRPILLVTSLSTWECFYLVVIAAHPPHLGLNGHAIRLTKIGGSGSKSSKLNRLNGALVNISGRNGK